MVAFFLCLNSDTKKSFRVQRVTKHKFPASLFGTIDKTLLAATSSHYETSCTKTPTMNSQMREFALRAIRTFGSPFKMIRLRIPYRRAEETLESPTGLSQMGQGSEANSSSASPESATSIAKPISPVSTEGSLTSEITSPSRASTSYTTRSMSDNSQPPPEREHHVKDKPQFTKGPSRVMMTFDGTTDCMALLLTQRLVTEFNGIIEEIHHIETANRELDEARSKANLAEQTAKEFKAQLETADDSNLRNDLSEKIEAQNQIFIANTGQQESITNLIVARNRNLKYRNITFQRIFGGALQDADLLIVPEIKTEGLNAPQSGEDRKDSITVPEPDESIVSAEELLRRNAYDDWEVTRDNLASARFAFDNREARYDEALMDYQDDLEQGMLRCTETDFACEAFERTRGLTRALINAEADYADAVHTAQALGVLVNEVDQESNFVSDISDGYPLSEEASIRAAVDKTFIEYWNDNIEDSGPEELEELEEPQEPDEWDAQTVGISDSVSVVDYSRNRKRIDRWREMCEQ